MKKHIFILLFSFIFLSAFHKQDPHLEIGKHLFRKKCAFCHGKSGTKGLFGAKNLQKSILTDQEYFSTISNGKNVMPSWKNKLTEDQINQIIIYIKTLRK
jgi:cytochrome c6